MPEEIRKHKVKTPLGKLGDVRGRPLPQHFELSILAIGKRSGRMVNGHGFLSFKRYRLFVDSDLKTERVEIREFFDSLVVTYQRKTVVSYAISFLRSEVIEVSNTPVFHEHPGIVPSPQMELFDLLAYPFRYVYRRPPYRKRQKYQTDATQLEIDFANKREELGD